MTPAAHPVLRRIDAHHVILETDGWLCFKYLDCGEESMSPFADVSKGDIIEWGLPGHTSASSDVLEEFWQRLYDGGAFSVNTICDAKRIYDEFCQQTKEQMRTKEREQG